MKSSFQSNNNNSSSSNKNSKFNKSNNNDHSYSSSYNSILIMSDHGGLSSPSAGQQSSGNGVDLDAAGSQDNDPADDMILIASKKSKQENSAFTPNSCYVNANYQSEASSGRAPSAAGLGNYNIFLVEFKFLELV